MKIRDATLKSTLTGSEDIAIDDGTSAALRTTLDDITRLSFPVINVKDTAYGATGDGTTDDTAAIQAALDAAAASSLTKTVYFPSGDYSVDTLTVAPQIKIIGSSGGNLSDWDHAAPTHSICRFSQRTAGTNILHIDTVRNNEIKNIDFIGQGPTTDFANIGLRAQSVITTATSGSLVTGRYHTITDYQTGDDFSNVGATLPHFEGQVFLSTGTTPTDWTNGSTLIQTFYPGERVYVEGCVFYGFRVNYLGESATKNHLVNVGSRGSRYCVYIQGIAPSMHVDSGSIGQAWEDVGTFSTGTTAQLTLPRNNVLYDDEIVRFGTDGTFPTGLSEFTNYKVVKNSPTNYTIQTESGGSVNITGVGSNTFVKTPCTSFFMDGVVAGSITGGDHNGMNTFLDSSRSIITVNTSNIEDLDGDYCFRVRDASQVTLNNPKVLLSDGDPDAIMVRQDNNTLSKTVFLNIRVTDYTTSHDGRPIIWESNDPDSELPIFNNIDFSARIMSTDWSTQEFAWRSIGPLLRARRTSDQSLPNNTNTALVFNSAYKNLGSAYSTSTGVFTAPVPGYYCMDLRTVLTDAMNSVSLRIRFYDESAGSTSTLYTRSFGNLSAGDLLDFDYKGLFMNFGDQITVEMYHNTGSSADIGNTGVNTLQTYYSIEKTLDSEI